MHTGTKGIKALIIILIFMVILGCSKDQPAENNQAVETLVPVETAIPAETEKPVETAAPDVDQEIETDPAVKAEFQDLVNKKAEASAFKSFVDHQIGKASITDYSIMVIALETAQDEQKQALEDRFYLDNMQEQLSKLHADGYDLIKLDTEAVSDPNVKQLLIDTREGGYKVVVADGAYMAHIDYETYEKYQAHVSDDISAYIAIKALETNDWNVNVNAAVTSDWDKVVKAAVLQEAFISKYPSSARLDAMKNRFANNVFVTFSGIESAPLFNYGDGLIQTDAKLAYTNAVKDGVEQSPYLARLSKFLELLNQSGDKQTEEVSKYQQETVDLWVHY